MTLVLVMTGFSGIGVYWVVNIGARQEFQYHPELDDFFCVLAAVSHTGTSQIFVFPASLLVVWYLSLLLLVTSASITMTSVSSIQQHSYFPCSSPGAYANC